MKRHSLRSITAQDYLVKDNVTPEILERSIRYAVQRQKSAAMRKLLDQLQANQRAMAKKNRRLRGCTRRPTASSTTCRTNSVLRSPSSTNMSLLARRDRRTAQR